MEVLDTLVVEKNVDVRFSRGFFGVIKVEMADTVQNWDTNTGKDDGKPYKKWRKATLEDYRENFKLV